MQTFILFFCAFLKFNSRRIFRSFAGIFVKEEFKEFDFNELVKAFVDKGWLDLGHPNFFS